MYNFPQLLKAVRREAGLTQAELAKAIDVSAVLIAMIESGQKQPSKKFVEQLADGMQVAPGSILPFMYDINEYRNPSAVETCLIKFGMNLQRKLIKEKAKNLSIKGSTHGQR